jgi:hypothetical protein
VSAWAWLCDYWQRLWTTPEPPAEHYPLITVDWGPPLEAQGGVKDLRDCGHISSSHSYDPLREEDICLECYRAKVGRKQR